MPFCSLFLTGNTGIFCLLLKSYVVFSWILTQPLNLCLCKKLSKVVRKRKENLLPPPLFLFSPECFWLLIQDSIWWSQCATEMYFNKALGFEMYLFECFGISQIIRRRSSLYVVQTYRSKLSQIFQIVINLPKWVQIYFVFNVHF